MRLVETVDLIAEQSRRPAFGVASLLVSYKAWALSRPWVWALLALGVLSFATMPWGVIVGVLTIVGVVQVIDRTPKPAAA